MANKKIGYARDLPDKFVCGATAKIEDTTATVVIAAPGAGASLYITDILVTNSDAEVGTLVSLTDGAAGDTLYAGYVSDVADGAPSFSVSLQTPLELTANTALYAKCGTTSAEVYVSASGFAV